MVIYFSMVLYCSREPLELQGWGCKLLVTLFRSPLKDGLAISSRQDLCSMQSPPDLYFSHSGRNSLSFFGPPHDTIFSLFPLGNSPNFFNDFSFYKCPEDSLASNNFNSVLRKLLRQRNTTGSTVCLKWERKNRERTNIN